MKFCLLPLAILLTFASVMSSEKEDEETVYSDPKITDNWIDPHKMVDDELVAKPYIKKAELKNSQESSKVQNKPESSKKNNPQHLQATTCDDQPSVLPDHPHLKHLVRVFLEATSDVNPFTEIKLSPENREILKKFLEDKANIHDVTNILMSNISNRTFTDLIKENYFTHVMERFGVINLVFVLLLLMLIMGIIAFEMRTSLTARKQFVYLLIGTFVVSIPWEWCRLYKKEFAAKQSMIMKNLEKHCRTDHELGFTESIHLWYLSSFTFDDNSCRKYQESLLIDPIWEVAPSKAVSVTITRFIVEPLEHIADATGKSFRALFQHLPWQWQPVMFLGCLVVVIFILILVSGIRISTPFLEIGLGVDPAIANASFERLENQMQQLMLQQRNAEDLAVENVRNVNNEHALIPMVQALNDRSQATDNQVKEIKDFLLQLRPVAEQARQAEAIEHRDPEEASGNYNNVEEERPQVRQPVQMSDSDLFAVQDAVQEVGHTQSN